MKLNTLFAAAVGAAAFSGAAHANVVYQSVPSIDPYPAYWCSDCYGGYTYEPLDPFSLAGGAQVTGVNLVTYNDYGYNGLAPFTLEIYDSTHSSIIFSQAVTPSLLFSGIDGNGYAYDVVNASVSGLNLSAGSYWVGFFAPYFSVAGGSGGNGGLIETQPPHSGTYLFDLGGNTEYQLLGAGVPEPATWAMMLVGFGAIGVFARRRTAKAAIA